VPHPVNLNRPAQRVVRQILDDGIGLVPGTAITIRTTDGAGTLVGQGQMTFHSEQGFR
jgi:hypothetical protein